MPPRLSPDTGRFVAKDRGTAYTHLCWLANNPLTALFTLANHSTGIYENPTHGHKDQRVFFTPSAIFFHLLNTFFLIEVGLIYKIKSFEAPKRGQEILENKKVKAARKAGRVILKAMGEPKTSELQHD